MKRFVGGAMLFLLAACAPPRTQGPPVIRYGRNVCSHCGMIVSEARYASGYIDPTGKSVIFDDLGEIFIEINGHSDLLARAYVNDVEATAWIPAKDAFYVRVAGLATPMGYGISAYRDQARASAFARNRKGVEGPFSLDMASRLFSRDTVLK